MQLPAFLNLFGILGSTFDLDLVVVTPANVSDEERYLELHSRFSGWYSGEDVKTKLEDREVCVDILKSEYFSEVQNVHMPNTPHVLPYALYEVAVLEKILYEQVFACVARNRSSNEWTQYYISREYSFTTGQDRDSRRTGRFVFKGDGSNGRLIAIAEHPARIWSFSRKPYPQKALLKLLLEGNSDAICEFTAIERLRLCSIIMNSKKYREVTLFSPYKYNYTEPRCEKLDLSTVYENSVKPTKVSFPQWAIECRSVAGFDYSGEPIMYPYYISRGTEPHQFLISRPIKTRNELSDYCYI